MWKLLSQFSLNHLSWCAFPSALRVRQLLHLGRPQDRTGLTVRRRGVAPLFAIFMALTLATFSYFGHVPPVLAQTVQPPILASLFSFSGTRPDNLGVTADKLAECPSSPNCVSSQSEDMMHQIEPLSYDESSTEAFENLKTLIESLDNSKMITAEDDYLYAEFSTPIMGFVDDVEFYLDQENKLIQVRSASRLGESDLGVNRNRVETIRSLFNS